MNEFRMNRPELRITTRVTPQLTKVPFNNMPDSNKNLAANSGKDDKLEDKTDDSTKQASCANQKKRFYIDASRLSEFEAEQLETRRAYNRSCAAKARQRSKDLISQLQAHVATHKEENAGLNHPIQVTRAKMQFLQRQNTYLITSQQSQVAPLSLLNSRQYGVSSSSFGGMTNNVDQALLALSNVPRLQLTRGLAGLSNASPVHFPSAALANLDPTSVNIHSSFPSNTRGFGQLPPR